MVKNKPTPMDLDTEKIPKKPNLNQKPPPSAKPTNASSPVRPSVAAASLKVVSPPRRAIEAWEKFLQDPDEKKPPAIKKESLMDDNEAILEASGLKFGSSSESDTSEPKKKPDQITRDAYLKFARIGHALAMRIQPGRFNKTGFQDYKFYCMLKAYKNKDRPDCCFQWMRKYHFETAFQLWYEYQEAVPSFNKNYTTRLYIMDWPEEISDQQAMLLAKVICKKLNDFRVDSDSKNDRPDAPLVIEDESDYESLFWIRDGVWNDVLSNAKALSRMEEENAEEPIGKFFFARKKDIVERYFRQGTLDKDTALRIGAPFDWMSAEAQEEWKLANNINE